MLIVYLLSFALAASAALVPRIIGGHPVSVNEVGYVAYIQYWNTAANQVLTTAGTLIAPNVVATLITSVMMDKDNLDRNVGYYNVGFPRKLPQQGVVYNARKVDKIILNPDFDSSNNHNNIALLILKEDVPKDVAIPTKVYTGTFTQDSTVKALGFGIQDPYNSTSHPSILSEAVMELRSQSFCNTTNPLFFPDSMLCTDASSGNDTCLGDDGGPLSIKTDTSDSGWALFGIYIFKYGTTDASGNRCAHAGSFTYYTYVAHYVDWIAKAANLNPRDFTVGDGSGISQTQSTTSNTDASSSNEEDGSSIGDSSDMSDDSSSGSFNSNGSHSSEKLSNRDIIIAAVCGSVGGILLVAVAFFVYRWWRRRQANIRNAQKFSADDLGGASETAPPHTKLPSVVIDAISPLPPAYEELHLSQQLSPVVDAGIQAKGKKE